ncbi:hypothetical protein [Paenibacillus sp. J2TS4]|uniref:hypothetical protein n=1 Tax=Paenibacillus sp. J2TS4 TaxID=2807194 RepID=UPI001B26C637|nr:hypothetical protein [Paenibacillus sp. J2TS4]GIP33043.1 hypothetical protein J2TS4_22530 [Paenibacillus sp. J2TS4]
MTDKKSRYIQIDGFIILNENLTYEQFRNVFDQILLEKNWTFEGETRETTLFEKNDGPIENPATDQKRLLYEIEQLKKEVARLRSARPKPQPMSSKLRDALRE